MRKLFALSLLLLGAFVLLGAQGITLGKGATYGKGMTISPGASGGGAAVFSYVNGAVTIGGCGSTYPCSISYSATAGNLLIVDSYIQDAGAGTTSGVSDNGSSGGSTYVAFFNHLDALAGGNGTPSEWYTLAAASGVTTITVAATGTHTGGTFTVREYHRTSGTWAIDQQSILATGTGTTTTCNSITTSANPVLVSGYLWQNTDATHTFTGSSGYTVRENGLSPSNGVVVGSADDIFTATGTYQASGTTTVSVTWACYTTSFK